ncbi:MAG: DUF3108 domain-containing protein, partial [Myxococcaceae bacterium]
MRLLTLAVACLSSLSAYAQGPKAAPVLAPPVPNVQCAALPHPRTPLAFAPGEVLEFTLDALGATAGKMEMRVLPVENGVLPVEVKAQTNTFFSKVRRVTGTGTSYLHPKSLHPNRYVENAVENDVPKSADVTFRARDRAVLVSY